MVLISPLDRLTAWIVEHLVSAGAPASWLAVPIRAAHGSTWAQASPNPNPNPNPTPNPEPNPNSNVAHGSTWAQASMPLPSDRLQPSLAPTLTEAPRPFPRMS